MRKLYTVITLLIMTGLLSFVLLVNANGATASPHDVPPAQSSGTVPASTPIPTHTNTPIPPTPTFTATASACVSIAPANLPVAEGVGSITFNLTLSNAIAQPVSVQLGSLIVQPDYATAGIDYGAVNQTVTIAANQTSAAFTVAINQDTIYELSESFKVVISSVTTNNACIANGEALVIILDDDMPPTNTSVPVDTNTSVPVDTGTPANTSVPVVTNTPVPFDTPTSLPVPTDTPTDMPTNTSVPVPTNTSVPVPTNTSVPVPTNTSVPVPTNTSVPVPTNTSVPVPTNTPIPPDPTDAPTNTSVPVVTNTPVPVVTNTPVPVVTNTPVPVVTNTPVPVVTNTPVPADTNTPVPADTNTPVPQVEDTDTPVPQVEDTVTPEPADTATSEPADTATSEPADTATSEPADTDTPEPADTDTPVPADTDTPVPADTDTPEPPRKNNDIDVENDPIRDPVSVFDPDGPAPESVTYGTDEQSTDPRLAGISYKTKVRAEASTNQRDERTYIAPGEIAIFVISYANNSDNPLYGVVITMIVPRFTIFRQANSGLFPYSQIVAAGVDDDGDPIFDQAFVAQLNQNRGTQWELPDGSAPCPDEAPAGTECVFRLGTINPGESGDLNVPTKIDEDAPIGGEVEGEDGIFELKTTLGAANLAEGLLIKLTDPASITTDVNLDGTNNPTGSPLENEPNSGRILFLPLIAR